MHYRNEKEILCDQIVALVLRETSIDISKGNWKLMDGMLFSLDGAVLSQDPEVIRLVTAYFALTCSADPISRGNFAGAPGETSQSTEITEKTSIIDEFQKILMLIESLKNEPDNRLAIKGILEILRFMVTFMAAFALSAKK